jgi:hypothetical protein
MYEPLIGLGVAIVLGIYRDGSRLANGSFLTRAYAGLIADYFPKRASASALAAN